MKEYRALDKWFQSPLGLFVAHEFTIQLGVGEEYLRGNTLLQLGHCGENTWLNQFHYQHQWIASPFPASQAQIECEFNHLPFDRNSVDCIIVPLSLEPFLDSLSLIDEIDRVLKPMGFVIFLCFNPWSLFGGALKLGFLNCYQNAQVKMHTPFSLNRTFIQRGYRQCALNNFCYLLPINSANAIKKFSFLDEIGKMIWPYPSGCYCYIVQKYQFVQPSLLLRLMTKMVGDYQPTMQPVTLFPSRN